jgi:general stress protein 26
MLNDENSASQSTQETRMWEIAEATDFCMFVTMDGNKPWARPMSTIARANERLIYMLTDRTSVKDDHIKANRHVALAYASNPTFLTVRGVATLSSDKEKIKELWSPGAQVFWPEGPEESNVVIIAVTPYEAEYWDGDNRLVTTAKFAWALATGTAISAGENKKLRLTASGSSKSSRAIKTVRSAKTQVGSKSSRTSKTSVATRKKKKR